MAEDCLPTEAFEKAEPIVVLPSKAPWYIVKLLQLFAWSRAMSIRSFAQRNTARVARVARWWKVPAEIVSAVLLRWKDRLMKSRMTAPNSGSVHTAWLSQKLQIIPALTWCRGSPSRLPAPLPCSASMTLAVFRVSSVGARTTSTIWLDFWSF